jgi:hypothetical protein
MRRRREIVPVDERNRRCKCNRTAMHYDCGLELDSIYPGSICSSDQDTCSDNRYAFGLDSSCSDARAHASNDTHR